MRRFSRSGVAFAILAAAAATVPVTVRCCLAACLTGADAEGPFYVRNAPARSRIAAPQTAGVALHLSGRVLANDCVTPVADAILDVWQADAGGCYSAVGGRLCPGAPAEDPFSLRGKLRTDSAGRYALETVKPAAYGNEGAARPPHIHVKVFVKGREVLTTQLYFQGERENPMDPLASAPAAATRTIALQRRDDGWHGAFDFVVDLGRQ